MTRPRSVRALLPLLAAVALAAVALATSALPRVVAESPNTSPEAVAEAKRFRATFGFPTDDARVADSFRNTS
jgi:hypothetical protein